MSGRSRLKWLACAVALGVVALCVSLVPPADLPTEVWVEVDPVFTLEVVASAVMSDPGDSPIAHVSATQIRHDIVVRGQSASVVSRFLVRTGVLSPSALGKPVDLKWYRLTEALVRVEGRVFRRCEAAGSDQ